MNVFAPSSPLPCPAPSCPAASILPSPFFYTHPHLPPPPPQKKNNNMSSYPPRTPPPKKTLHPTSQARRPRAERRPSHHGQQGLLRPAPLGPTTAPAPPSARLGLGLDAEFGAGAAARSSPPLSAGGGAAGNGGGGEWQQCSSRSTGWACPAAVGPAGLRGRQAWVCVLFCIPFVASWFLH